MYLYYFQLAVLQSKRSEELKRLCDQVCQIENDTTIKLDASWKEYFKGRLDWASGEGKGASLSEIEKWHNDVQQRVRFQIRLYETVMPR